MNKNKNPQTTHGREQNEDGKFYYGFDNPKKPGNILTIKVTGCTLTALESLMYCTTP